MRLLPGAAYRDQTIEPCQKTKTKGQLRGDDFMNELDRRIQTLTPEDMLDTSERGPSDSRKLQDGR